MAKVLFIDDEPIYYRMILPTFKEQGLELRYSKNGMEGLAEVPLFMPDVIITDVRLPDISGYEIAERMRRDPRFSRIPIIFVTGQSDLKDKLKAFELGADDYLVKPFQPEELAARISPRTVDVIISGPVPLLDRLTESDVQVQLDLSGVSAGTYQFAPRVDISIAELKVESILPSSIEVVVEAPAAVTPQSVTPTATLKPGLTPTVTITPTGVH